MRDEDVARIKAPPDACMACARGPTKTGIVLTGPPRWIRAKFAVITGAWPNTARRMLGEKSPIAFRLCRDCADKAGVPVGEYPVANLPVIGPAAGDDA